MTFHQVYVIDMTNEIDEKALVREGDWLETEGEIDWPNLPGIHFDYTEMNLTRAKILPLETCQLFK